MERFYEHLNFKSSGGDIAYKGRGSAIDNPDRPAGYSQEKIKELNEIKGCIETKEEVELYSQIKAMLEIPVVAG